jgi:hypothetical protein
MHCHTFTSRRRARKGHESDAYDGNTHEAIQLSTIHRTRESQILLVLVIRHRIVVSLLRHPISLCRSLASGPIRSEDDNLPISSCETSDLDFFALSKSSASERFFLFFSSSIAFLSLALSSSISSPSFGLAHPTASLRFPDLSSSALVAALSASAASWILSCSSRVSSRASVERAELAARPA